MRGSAGGVEREAAQAVERGEEARGSRLGVQDARLAVQHRLGRPPEPERDDRRPAGLRLQRHDAEILLTRHQHGLRGAVQVAQHLVVGSVEESDRLTGPLREAGALGPEPRDREGQPAGVRGVDGVVEALVRGERRHDEEAAPGRPGRRRRVELRVHGRKHDGSLASPQPGDAASHVLRIREKGVHARHGRAVPRAKRGPREARRRPGRRGAVAEVVVELVVQIPHGRVAVAEVEGARRLLRVLGDAVGGRDHEVEPREVPGLGRDEEEGEQLPVVRARRDELLEERRPDFRGLDLGGLRAGKVEEREDGRARKHPDQLQQHLLAAARARQPVVDEGDLHESALARRVVLRLGRGCFFFEWVTKNALIHLRGALRRAPPREFLRPRPSPLSSKSFSSLHLRAISSIAATIECDVVRIEEHRRVARGLAESGEVRARDGRARRLRLENRQSEALGEGRQDERAGAGERARARPHPARSRWPSRPRAASARARRPRGRATAMGFAARTRGHAREQPVEVLVRLVVAEKEKIREKIRRRFFERKNGRTRRGHPTRAAIPLFPF